MPPATFPPTPAPSTDIKGIHADSLPHEDSQFQLPPSAVAGHGAPPLKLVSPQALASPESVKASRHSSGGSEPSDFSLPPPPSRSRKSIQPASQAHDGGREEDAAYVPPGKATKSSKPAKAGGKRSTATANTAAGRKVARKTAHSIIERRRRSKMNEEFGVLKDLIPSCRGVEMHKLAILQASIDYMRYLESCVGDLKAGREHSSEAPSRRSVPHDDDDLEEAAASDDDMEVDELPARNSWSAKGIVAHHDSQQPSSSGLDTTATAELSSNAAHYDHRSPTSSTAASSAALPSPYFGPVTSNSSVYSYNGPSFSRKSSAVTTPVFGPLYSNNTGDRHASTGWPGFQASDVTDRRPSQITHERTSSSAHAYSRSGSTQTSPVIVPKDQGLNEAEASTALLMLNKDRRHSSQGQKRGLSVKDLLGS